jgi:hypothetical protein
LAAAIALQPEYAEAYLDYAEAVRADVDADPRKAWKACRRATRLDSLNPRCWVALGHASLYIADETWAARAFRRAAQLQPDNVSVLADVVRGLESIGRDTQARRVLEAARFRSPGNAALVQLCNDFRSRLAIRQHLPMTGEPTILRFPGRASDAAASASHPVVLRVDRRSRSTPHLFRLFGRQVDPRRAN